MNKTQDLFSIKHKNILLIGFKGILGKGYKNYLIGKCKTLILADMKISDVSETISISKKETKIIYKQVDVSDEVSVKKLFDDVQKYTPIHSVISNAAITGEFLRDEGFKNPFPIFEDYPLGLFKKTLVVF